MTSYSPVQTADIYELAACYGVASSYTDGIGVERSMTPETLSSILTSLGVPAESPPSLLQSIKESHNRNWQQLVDEVVVIAEGARSPSMLVSLPIPSSQLQDVSLSWTIEDERQMTQSFSRQGATCQIVGDTVINRMSYVRVRLPLQSSLALGYYWVSLFVTSANHSLSGKTFLVVAPRQCYTPPKSTRSFGVSIQLYSVHSAQNWGIGDFRDLKGLLRWAQKDLGATTIGVSPLHDPTVGVCSPYSPSSRLFFNALYLDLEAIAEFRSTPAIKRRFNSHRFQATLQRLRASSHVQYDKVRALKSEMLEGLYRAFKKQHQSCETSSYRTFKKYCQTRGEHLEPYCLYQVLSEHFGTHVWRQWPKEYHTPHSQHVKAFFTTSQDRIQYFQYVQWQCEQQLVGLDRMAKRLNLTYRLYHDLPVGVHPDGADAWMFQDELASGITLGAPPDDFNRQGQNWGLMAPVPWRMRAAGYRFFIETIRLNMRYGGMLRIDHALGLFRLFMVPEGSPGDSGTYVNNHVDEILAILALESVRHQVMIVGEDLGVVTQEIRARLTKSGILSYRLMPFEKTRTGKFRTPKQYPKQAIVSFTTHDLPTFMGYWAGRDIDTKSQANLYQSERQIEQEWEGRMEDRIAFLHALVNEKLLPKKVLSYVPLQAPKSFVRAAYVYLAQTSCRVLMIPLEDLLCELEAPNLPGATSDTYPSWQLRLHRSIQSFRHDSQIPSMTKAVRMARARP
ncbi:MAG: 4-alpha-glucanotransferase [Nitrospirales bacterium]